MGQAARVNGPASVERVSSWFPNSRLGTAPSETPFPTAPRKKLKDPYFGGLPLQTIHVSIKIVGSSGTDRGTTG
jgi:hypothetical protein